MAILDDLKGILGDEAIAKIEGNPALKMKLAKGEELYGYYAGDDDTTASATATVTQPAAAAAASHSQFDLGSIERMLDAKLGNMNKTIEDKIGEVVKTRGDELVNSAVKIALQRSDELNRIYMEHQSNYGESFNSEKFNEYLEQNKDKGFRSIRQAYESYVQPRAMDREVDRRVDEKLKKSSGGAVPGTTPAPSVNSNIRHFKARSASADGQGMTGAQRAAAMLDKRMADSQAAAS